MTSFYTNLFHVTGTLMAIYGSAYLSRVKPEQESNLRNCFSDENFSDNFLSVLDNPKHTGKLWGDVFVQQAF
jgi:hypothetical protein